MTSWTDPLLKKDVATSNRELQKASDFGRGHGGRLMEGAAAWLEALGAAGAGLYAAKLYWLKRAERLAHLEIASGFAREFRASSLDPGRFVGAYSVRTKEYLPTTVDEEIAQSLESNSDILLTGRGGIGKSHTAVEHIARYARRHWIKRWKVLLLDRDVLQEPSSIRVGHKRYIIFFDDIDEYLRKADGYDVLATMRAVRDRAKQVRVVATLRSTLPHVEAIESATKLLSRLKVIDLPDWSNDQRDALLTRTRVAPERWDGTPLSAKQPSSEMRGIYATLAPPERWVLDVAKTLDGEGLHFCNRLLLIQVIARCHNASEEALADVVTKVRRYGFFKRDNDFLQVYSPYLDFITPLHSDLARPVLRQLLLEKEYHREALAVAKNSYDRDDLDDAQSLLLHLTQSEGVSAVAHYRLALTYLRQRNWQAAIGSLESAVTLRPDYLSALFRLARAYTQVGDKRSADLAYTKARGLQKEQGSKSLVLGAEGLLQDGDTESALALIELALQKDPEVQHGWGIKGQIHLRRKEPNLAKEAFSKALLNSPDGFVYFGLGQLARTEKHWEEAEDYFKKSIELTVHSAPTYSLLGQAFTHQDKIPEAIEAFREALKGGSEENAHLGLGLLYHRKKDWANAAYHLGIVTSIDPNSHLAYSYLGDALMNLRQFTDGLSAYRASISLNPASKHLHYSYAAALARLGRGNEAIEELDRCLQIDSEFGKAKQLRDKLVRSPTP
jgi:tetratricopeptide (TPR) repeat protein